MGAKRKSLSLKEKRDLIVEIEANCSRKDICSKYGIALSTVSHILKTKTQIKKDFQTYSGKLKRKRGYPELDFALLKWYRTQIASNSNFTITGPLLLEKGNEIVNRLGVTGILKKGSLTPSWIDRFKERHGILFRLAGNGGAQPPVADSESECMDAEDTENAAELESVEPTPLKTGIKRKSLSLKEKRDLIVEIEEMNCSRKDVCSKYGIALSTLSHILKTKTQIKKDFQTYSGKLKRKRASGYPEVDFALLKWYRTQRASNSNFIITGPLLLEKGNEIANRLGVTGNLKNGSLTPSWIDRFKERHGILFRSGNIQDPPPVVDWESMIAEDTENVVNPGSVECDDYETEDSGIKENDLNQTEKNSCANCLSMENPESFKSTLNSISLESELDVITTHQAVTLIYALDSNHEKKDYYLCPYCIQVLTELYSLYTHFKGLTHRTSRIHTAMEFCRSAYPFFHSEERTAASATNNHPSTIPNPPQGRICQDEGILPIPIQCNEAAIRLRLERRSLRRKLHRQVVVNTESCELDTDGYAEAEESVQFDDADKEEKEEMIAEQELRKSKKKSTKSKKQEQRGPEHPRRMNYNGALEQQIFNKKVYECPECGIKRRSIWTLHFHARTAHRGLRAFACSLCPKKFAAPGGLSDHIRVQHAENNADETKVWKYFCKEPGCGKVFSYNTSLRQHHFVHYPGEQKYQCTHCQHKYRSNHELKTHMLKHSDERNAVCEHCGTAYKSKNTLRFHQKHLHPEVFSGTPYLSSEVTCNLCQKSFRRPANLRLHIRTVHDEIKPFKCELCGHGFSNSSNLKGHSRACRKRQERHESQTLTSKDTTPA